MLRSTRFSATSRGGLFGAGALPSSLTADSARRGCNSSGWYTVEECAPGLYRYVYRASLVQAPAGSAEVESSARDGGLGGPQTDREEPEAMKNAPEPAEERGEG